MSNVSPVRNSNVSASYPVPVIKTAAKSAAVAGTVLYNKNGLCVSILQNGNIVIDVPGKKETVISPTNVDRIAPITVTSPAPGAVLFNVQLDPKVPFIEVEYSTGLLAATIPQPDGRSVRCVYSRSLTGDISGTGTAIAETMNPIGAKLYPTLRVGIAGQLYIHTSYPGSCGPGTNVQIVPPAITGDKMWSSPDGKINMTVDLQKTFAQEKYVRIFSNGQEKMIPMRSIEHSPAPVALPIGSITTSTGKESLFLGTTGVLFLEVAYKSNGMTVDYANGSPVVIKGNAIPANADIVGKVDKTADGLSLTAAIDPATGIFYSYVGNPNKVWNPVASAENLNPYGDCTIVYSSIAD